MTRPLSADLVPTRRLQVIGGPARLFVAFMAFASTVGAALVACSSDDVSSSNDDHDGNVRSDGGVSGFDATVESGVKCPDLAAGDGGISCNLTDAGAESNATGLRISILDQDGHPYTGPGGTLSIRAPSNGFGSSPAQGYGPSFLPDFLPSFVGLEAGVYEVGLQVPDGYAASYSLGPGDASVPYGSYVLDESDDASVPGLTVTVPAAGALDIGWVITPLATPLDAGFPTSQLLSCNIPGEPDATAPTLRQTFKGTSAWAEVGLAGNLGGIAVSLTLSNPAASADAGAPLQIIDARSSGGAAWQTSFGVQESGRTVNYNQAAGNSARLWGYGSDYTNDVEGGLVQKQWNPLFANDNKSVPGASDDIATSPCYHTGARLGDGMTSIVPALLDGGGADVLRLASTYSVRYREDGSFTSANFDQALYLLTASARAANLRIYWPLETDSGAAAITDPPLYPYDLFCTFKTSVPVNCAQSGSSFLRTEPIAYAVLVWTVQGEDIAMAIHPANPSVRFTGIPVLRQHETCDSDADTCGNTQFHVDIGHLTASHDAGAIETYTIDYDIGTVAQVAALGFPIHVP